MSTVIYISNKQIQVITAKGVGLSAKPEKSFILDSPEGSVINGIVMDPEAMVTFMKGFFTQTGISTKDVSLVVNSNKIAGKRIELPLMNDVRTLEFAKREFDDMERETEQVICYTTLPTEKGSKLKRIYAEAVERDFVQDYVELFREMGITLKGIYSGEGTLIKMIEKTAAKISRTFIVQIADANILTNILWVDGSFTYYSSQRCFSDPGTAEYYEECVRALSQLMQFMKANQIESPIECIYVGGMQNMDMNTYQILAASSRIEAQVTWYDCGLSNKAGQNFDYTTVLPSLGGLIGQEKTSNMLKNFSVKKKKQADAFWKKSFILIGAVFAIMFVLTAAVIFKNHLEKKELERVKEYNESPAVMFQLADYDRCVVLMAAGYDRYASYTNMNNAINTYPIFNNKLTDPIEACASGLAKIEISSFDAEAGQVSFTATADNVENINKFIGKLFEEKIFNDVNYTGYSYNSSEDVWDIHVTCTLSEGAGR